MSPDLTPGGSYDDQASRLLADIADLLLGGKKDWRALERLQNALSPKSGLTEYGQTYRKLSSMDPSPGFEDIMKEVYSKKIAEDLYRSLPPVEPKPEESKQPYTTRFLKDTAPIYSTSANYNYLWMDDKQIRGFKDGSA